MIDPESRNVLGGIVLAGGRSSRMGRDKAGLDWRGRPLVAHVAAILRDCVAHGPVVVVGSVAGPAPAWAAALPAGVELVHDDEAYPGPVAGLAAGMAALEGRARRALLAGTDQPFLFRATFAPLLDATPGTAAWRADEHLQPLGAVYAVGPPTDATRLKDLLTHATILDADAQTKESLRSLDTPEAYERGLR